jgi:hypothetical protein
MVEGKVYYRWDAWSGSSDINDYFTMNALESMFFGQSAGNIFTDSNRTLTFGAANAGLSSPVVVKMPTFGGTFLSSGNASGTSYNANKPAGTQINDPTLNGNTTYNDLLAIWDGLSTAIGTGGTTGATGTRNGQPTNWKIEYWSASQGPFADFHGTLNMSTGYVYNKTDTSLAHVAFEWISTGSVGPYGPI